MLLPIYNQKGEVESLDYNSIFTYVIHDYLEYKKELDEKIKLIEKIDEHINYFMCYIFYYLL